MKIYIALMLLAAATTLVRGDPLVGDTDVMYSVTDILGSHLNEFRDSETLFVADVGPDKISPLLDRLLLMPRLKKTIVPKL